jgi:site-specific recombinase XerD
MLVEPVVTLFKQPKRKALKRGKQMHDIRWEHYPLVANDELAHSWLQLQMLLQLAPSTIDAYGRCLNDYLAFCIKEQTTPSTLTREHIASYVHDLATRPHPKGSHILTLDSGRGLANATMKQRITVARLYQDFLMERQIRSDNPVTRGHYVPGKAFGGHRARALLPSYRKLPWIPNDEEWRTLLSHLKETSLRNRVMFLLAYDGALRREELVRLEIGDFDFAYCHIHIRAEAAKNGAERIVGYGKMVTSPLLQAYLAQRRVLTPKAGPLFLSESHRNPAQPLSLVMWSKIVQQIAERTGLPRLTTHTLRHLRLTHLARAHLDLHEIARYAGHRSLQTTLLYIHLSGVEWSEAVSRSLATFERWMSMALEEEKS